MFSKDLNLIIKYAGLYVACLTGDSHGATSLQGAWHVCVYDHVLNKEVSFETVPALTVMKTFSLPHPIIHIFI